MAVKKDFQLDIVSAEGEVFSGTVQKLFVTGVEGELEILAGHAPLLTALSPGPVWVEREDNKEDGFVIFGGMLEVQPDITIILADAALRAHDIDEAAALEAKQNTEKAIAQRETDLDYAKAHAELAHAVAQLRLIKKLRQALK